jgi:hypothetical protein
MAVIEVGGGDGVRLPAEVLVGWCRVDDRVS